MLCKIIVIVLVFAKYKSVPIDFVELIQDNPLNSFFMRKPYRVSEVMNDLNLRIVDEKCENLVISTTAVSRRWTVEGDDNLKSSCNLAPITTDYVKGMQQLKPFALVMRSYVRPLEFLYDEQGKLIFRTMKTYPFKGFDLTSNRYEVYSNNCTTYAVKAGHISRGYEKIVSSSKIKPCELEDSDKILIQNRSSGLSLANSGTIKLMPLDLKSDEITSKLTFKFSELTKKPGIIDKSIENITCEPIFQNLTKTLTSTVISKIAVTDTIKITETKSPITTTSFINVTDTSERLINVTHTVTETMIETQNINVTQTWNQTYTTTDYNVSTEILKEIIYKNVTQVSTVYEEIPISVSFDVPSPIIQISTETIRETVNLTQVIQEQILMTQTEYVNQTIITTETVNYTSLIQVTGSPVIANLSTDTIIEFINVTAVVTETIVETKMVSMTEPPPLISISHHTETEVRYTDLTINNCSESQAPIAENQPEDIPSGLNSIDKKKVFSKRFTRSIGGIFTGTDISATGEDIRPDIKVAGPVRRKMWPTQPPKTTTSAPTTTFAPTTPAPTTPAPTTPDTTESPMEKLLRRNLTINTIEELYKIKNRFDNQTFIAESGRYGIQYTKIGELLAFSDEFTHFVRYEFPFNNFRLIRDPNEDSCINFLNKIPNIQEMLGGNASIEEALKRACESFEESMKLFSEQIEATAEGALEEFKIRQIGRTNRRKRFEPVTLTILAGVAGAAAVTWGLWATTNIINGKHERKELYQKVAQLENQVDQIAESIKVLGEGFIGFSQEVSAAFESYDKKLNMLKDFSIQQSIHARESLKNTTIFLDQSTKIVALLSIVNDYRLSQANILQNNLIILLDGLSQYERIFSSLQQGRLSHSLLPWTKMKKILDYIADQYSKEFDFAINHENKELYYSLPLVSHSIDIKTNDIYVSIRIPLTRRKEAKVYSIYKVESSPFTCLTKECFGFDNLQKSVYFQITSNLLLVHPMTGDLMEEVSIDSITCNYVEHKKLCFTFNRNNLVRPSECSRSLHEWNHLKILANCPLKPRSINEYKPISLGSDRYVIHKNVIPTYDIMCFAKNVIRANVEKWSEIIQLEKNCDVYLPDIKRMLYAPYTNLLRSDYTENVTSYHSDILDMIEIASNQSKLDYREMEIDRPDLPDYKAFNPEEYAVVVEWDQNRLSQFSKYVHQLTLNMSASLKNLEMVMESRSGEFSLKGIISTLSGITQLLMTILMVFGVLSYSRTYGRTASLLIIRPRAVEASILGGFDLVPIDMQSVIDISILILLAGMATLIMHLIFFRKHFISSHFGRARARDSNSMGWTLMICIIQTTVSFCAVNTENVYLRYPVTVFKRERVRDLRIVSPLITWTVRESDGNRTFAINEDVNLFHLDMHGNRLSNKWQQVNFRISDIDFTHRPLPVLFNSKNAYGSAILSVTKDNSTYN